MPPGILGQQAAAALAMGSPFVAAVLAAGERQLHRAPHTAALIAGWPGDAAADALAMRFNAALHALARAGSDARLSALYAAMDGAFDTVIGDAIARFDAWIAAWMAVAPQTNEVGRTAAIMAALMVVQAERPMPVALYELGASAGLNLNLARYRFDLGGTATGPAAAPVLVAPAWRGVPPPAARVTVAAAQGVDLHPLDIDNAAACDRLMAYVWADDPDRAARLSRALALARVHRPAVTRGDMVGWLPQALAAPQPDGQCRVVMHSMALQYLDAASRDAVERTLAGFGAQATERRPLARIAFEWDEDRTAVQLCLTTWPDGATRRLATCHAYGKWIAWEG